MSESAARMLTEKGSQTRGRIVEAAADLVLERGAHGTSLDDIRAATKTSKSQLFHYFPGGKGDLVAAIGDFQFERVLAAQRPELDHLDSWASWDAWRESVLTHYGAQPSKGCPIGALTAELVRSDSRHAQTVLGHMDRWRGYLEAGVSRMRDNGTIGTNACPYTLSMSVFAALQGGLALTAMMDSVEPLRASLQATAAILRDAR